MKTAYAIRHLAFEDLGSFEAQLLERGFNVHYLEAGIDSLNEHKLVNADLLCVLGGPIGANDEHDYPFINDELTLLKARLLADRPTLGICLGAQLMARALGARVYPGMEKEIGWKPLQLTQAGKDSCIRYLDASFTSMLHWHGDTFDLPDGSTLLASTDICPNQVFAYQSKALAFQCHPEIIPARLEQWYIGHTGEIAGQGLSVPQLRAETRTKGENLLKQSRLFFKAWLDELGF